MIGATVVAVFSPPVGVLLVLTIETTYGALELGTTITGKDWLSGRELGTGERWLRGLLSPLDIVPGVAGIKKFATGARLGNQVVNLGQMAVKPGLKYTIKREIVHVGDMMNTAGKMTVQRVKNAGSAIKDAANVAKNKLAKDIGRVADSSITSVKNITSTRKVILAGDVGKVHIPAENTHFFENKAKQMFSKAEGVGGNRSVKEVDYGQRLGGSNTDDPPCTLNGFTGSRNGEILPEWQFNNRYLPRDRAELYSVKNGVEELVAVYDEKLELFIQVP